MIIFAVLIPVENPQLEATLVSLYPNDHIKVGPGQYLVAAKSTAVDLSNALGITDGKNGNGIILTTSAYYGRSGNNIWEWMKLKVSIP